MYALLTPEAEVIYIFFSYPALLRRHASRGRGMKKTLKIKIKYIMQQS